MCIVADCGKYTHEHTFPATRLPLHAYLAGFEVTRLQTKGDGHGLLAAIKHLFGLRHGSLAGIPTVTPFRIYYRLRKKAIVHRGV